jgi:hypothetical protein
MIKNISVLFQAAQGDGTRRKHVRAQNPLISEGPSFGHPNVLDLFLIPGP